MKTIISYIKRYFYESDKRLLCWVTVLTALLIFLNYRYHIDDRISDRANFLSRFAGRYSIFFIAFGIPYLLNAFMLKKKFFSDPVFILFLLIAPAIFSLKAGLKISVNLSDDPHLDDYWNHVIYWPLLLLIVGVALFVIWRIFDAKQPFYGVSTKNMIWKPYWMMLLLMLPLVAAASTQPDFLAVYPKLKLIVNESTQIDWWHKLLFELSYGSDFIGIELFFRGFLVLAFIKWAGRDAILPMACFYCTIHFGKPLGECISSYFGGLLLGIVVFNTRSIWGGLMVHLGIAWLMELGGYIGNMAR